MLSRTARRQGLPGPRPPDGVDALPQHHGADGPEKGHVGQGDHQAGLAKLTQDLEEDHAGDGARHATYD